MIRQRSIVRLLAVAASAAILQIPSAQAQSAVDDDYAQPQAPQSTPSDLDWLSDDPAPSNSAPDNTGSNSDSDITADDVVAAEAENDDIASDENAEPETSTPQAEATGQEQEDTPPDLAATPPQDNIDTAPADTAPSQSATADSTSDAPATASSSAEGEATGAANENTATAVQSGADPGAEQNTEAAQEQAGTNAPEPATVATEQPSGEEPSTEEKPAVADADTETTGPASGETASKEEAQENRDNLASEPSAADDASTADNATAEAVEPVAPAANDDQQDAVKEAEAPAPEAEQEEAAAPVAPAANDDQQDAVKEAEAPAPEAKQEEVAAPVIRKDVTLKIATWSGAYGQSQERALFRPFEDETGYKAEIIEYNGSSKSFEKQQDQPNWSLIDMNGDAMVQACEEGRLEKLQPDFLKAAPDGTAAASDFLPGAIHECGVASMAWSAVMVFDNRIVTTPTSLNDFFDTSKIPGRRILPKQPRYSLELALMADGVAQDKIYAMLASQEGQDRAFAKLSSIKDDIIWWEQPSQVFAQIAEKKAVMGLGFNGRAFMAIMGSKLPLAVLWDQQIYSYDYWAIPKGAPHQAEARNFIAYATGAEPLAEQAKWIPYGPARSSAARIVGNHPELGIDMKPHLPTTETNFSAALAFDGGFWRKHGEELNERFAKWVSRRQLPVQKQAVISQQ